jgi:hypothetical protein
MITTKIKCAMVAVLVGGMAVGAIGTAVGLSTNLAAIPQEKQAVPTQPARQQLKDPDPRVRLKAAVELSKQLDEEAIPVLIDLLAVLPALQRRQAELTLQAIADEWSPNPALARDDEVARRILRDAWAGWWRNVDGPVLLAAFQKRTLNSAQTVKAVSYIADLDSEEFATRQHATAEIVAMRLPIVPLLRDALPAKSLEQSRRIQQCIQDIVQARAADALPNVAARLLALRKPAGAVETLLAYVPFTDDEGMKWEVTRALHRLARTSATPDVSLVLALNDTLPARRAVAGAVLAAVTDGKVRAAVRKLLADPSVSVRLHVAIALVCAADRDAVPRLIDLLADLPSGELWKAEEILHRVAGVAAPQIEAAEDAVTRPKYRDAWKAWWKDNAATTKLTALPVPPPLLGFTVIAAIVDKDSTNSRILEVDRNGKVRWQFDGVNYPVDVHVLPGNRVLISEINGRRITERDFKGNILWQKDGLPARPYNAQRLANGDTFVCTGAGLMQFDGDGKTVLDIKVDKPLAGCKTADGQMFYLKGDGSCTRLDAAGKEDKRFVSGQDDSSLCGIDLTPRGRILVELPRQNAVGEFDVHGNRLRQPTVAPRTNYTGLRNGHVMAANFPNGYVAEVDRAGKVVWQYQLQGGYNPWRARQR